VGLLLLGTVVLAAACGTAPSAPPTSSAHLTTTTPKPHPVARSGWSTPVDISGGTALTAISCPTASFCLAGSLAGRTYRFDGAHWSGPLPGGIAGPSAGRTALACVSAAFCVALGVGDDRVAIWAGASWSAPATIAGAHGLQAVACASDRFCVAIDAVGDAFYYRGASWSPGSNDWGSVTGIACASPTFCVSVSGGISTWNGASWTEPAVFGATSALSAVSCPSASSCAADDAAGQVLDFDGSRWHVEATLDSSVASAFGATADLTGISCPAPSRCTAVDGEGDVFRLDGRTWSRAVAIDKGHALAGVSCAAPRFCAAVDDRGDVTTAG